MPTGQEEKGQEKKGFKMSNLFNSGNKGAEVGGATGFTPNEVRAAAEAAKAANPAKKAAKAANRKGVDGFDQELVEAAKEDIEQDQTVYEVKNPLSYEPNPKPLTVMPGVADFFGKDNEDIEDNLEHSQTAEVRDTLTRAHAARAEQVAEAAAAAAIAAAPAALAKGAARMVNNKKVAQSIREESEAQDEITTQGTQRAPNLGAMGKATAFKFEPAPAPESIQEAKQAAAKPRLQRGTGKRRGV